MSGAWMVFAGMLGLLFATGEVSWEMLVGALIGLLIVMVSVPFVMRRRRPKYLRATLWDSVQMEDGKGLPPARRKPFCRHREVRGFVRTDSREGPGWMSDSYQGSACAACGRIITERKVY